MAIKYINIFQSKALPTLSKLGFLKINHLATLLCAVIFELFIYGGTIFSLPFCCQLKYRLATTNIFAFEGLMIITLQSV
jgi:hypothetical protein